MAPGVRRPWAIVTRALDGPVDVAAVALRGVTDDRSPRDVSVLAYLGAVPLTSATYPRFVELSTRLGAATAPEGGDAVVFVVDPPITAHYVWIRVHSTWGGPVVALNELAVLTPDQLATLQAQSDAGVSVIALQPSADSSYDGIDLGGIEDVWEASPDLDTGTDGPPEDGGSEARDESAPVDAPADTTQDP